MSTIPYPDPNNNTEPSFADETSRVDLREALFNDGAVGKIHEVQVSTERIVRLNGILYDLDPKLFKTSPLTPLVPQDPDEFYAAVARPWLSRHPVLSRGEVRNSGSGLHVILRFDEPVEIESDEDRKRWAGIIKVVQCTLPIDPDQPHITAVTRPLCSVNAKNGATVTQLNPGEPVPIADVLAMYHEMYASPFKTVMKILAGTEKLEPCPSCNKPGTKLSSLDFVGHCYGSCGKVTLEQLFDLVLSSRARCKEAMDVHGAVE